MPQKNKKEIYRVWVNQVNQTYVDVEATSEEDAREKGYRKWRSDEGHSSVSCVERLESPNTQDQRRV